jgi:hypothetical protein
VERWLAGLRSGEVKAVVARAAEELERWLGAVKGGRYADYSSGRAARICAGGVQYDALAASARRGVLAAAKVGDVARLWKAYVDGVESYLTDPAKQEELRREAERWIKALRLNTTAEEAVARGLEMLKALRDTGLFDALRTMAQRLGEPGVETVDKMLKTLEGGEFWLETTPTGKAIKICGEKCLSVDQRGVHTMELEGLSAEVQIPRLLPEEYVKRLHIGWLASDESRNPRGFAIMGTTQLWQLYAWLITKPGRIRIHTEFGIKEGRDVDKAVCILKRFTAKR